ncbi:MAG: response regulator [Rhodopseudomonas palustris]|nr:response regulator [Rhodopseudomonas palustris]
MNSDFFDVIISDYAIPDIDGITLLKEVRARGYAGLFIIVTEKHRAHIAIDALNNGANYYFQKGGEAVQDIPQAGGIYQKWCGESTGRVHTSRA